MMRIWCFQGEKNCNTVEELNEILKLRSEKNSNEFYLMQQVDYPYLDILVKDDWAYVIYFKEDGDNDPGIYAFIDENGLDHEGTMTFDFGSLNNPLEMSNAYIIPLEKAYEIAREYFLTNELSKEIKWFEL